MAASYEEVQQALDGNSRDLVDEIHEAVTKDGVCYCEVKEQKSGYMLSYRAKIDKRIVANIVFRKSAIKIRIYAEHVADYQDFISTLPTKVKKEIEKAPICKRLVNPADCNQKCAMGYTFMMDGELCQKCRYSAFMPSLSTENNSYIIEFLRNETAK